MADVTLATAQAAQQGDITACAEVIAATEKIVGRLARDHAQRIATNAPSYRADLAEELEGEGRLAVWEHISKWNGGAAFTTYMHTKISAAIAEAAQKIVAPGADVMALKCFVRMLKIADGDVILAERLCTTLPKAGQRLSAERANAARLAFVGASSIDAPQPGGTSLADTVADDLEIPADLVTAADMSASQRKARHALVHATLGTLSGQQRAVLKARSGFDGFPNGDVPFGLDPAAQAHGISNTEAAELLGITPDQANDAWRKGARNFAGRFPIATAY